MKCAWWFVYGLNYDPNLSLLATSACTVANPKNKQLQDECRLLWKVTACRELSHSADLINEKYGRILSVWESCDSFSGV